MVLIKLRELLHSRQLITPFTFQYGSNQIIPSLTSLVAIDLFTFQYGSNQILFVSTYQKVYMNLHSNMVLIKSLSSIAIFSLDNYLHSNMVLIKWLKFSKL